MELRAIINKLKNQLGWEVKIGPVGREAKGERILTRVLSIILKICKDKFDYLIYEMFFIHPALLPLVLTSNISLY